MIRTKRNKKKSKPMVKRYGDNKGKTCMITDLQANWIVPFV